MPDETMSKGLGLIIGDVPLARFIFDDPSKRRFVPKLKADGWPIIEVETNIAVPKPAVVNDLRIVGVGDALFDDGPGQTWRYADPAS
jgi:hypothetical protein